MCSSGRRERAGAPKTINEKDRPAVRLGQSVLISAFPPVATAAERQAASEFNTRRRSCELEAQKDTVERRYVPRLIIRPVSFLHLYVPVFLPLLPVYLRTSFGQSLHITPPIAEHQWLQINFFVFILWLTFPVPPPPSPLHSPIHTISGVYSNLFPPPTSYCERGSGARHQWEKSSDALISLWAQD